MLIGVTTIALIAAATGITASVGNTFRYTQRSVTIPGPDGDLARVLTLPDDEDARGVVIMVHGDAPVEATHDGLYAPWFEGAADAGFATLSWSKPGVGGSEGDWLSQTMDDRAVEVSAAIDWAHRRGDIPTDAIVLWGASQAGWVLPKITASRTDIDAVVAVGTAINWLRQGRFNLLAELDHDGADADTRTLALAESDRTRELLERGASHEEYLVETTDDDPMSAERWNFVMSNHGADATADLRMAAGRQIPVHLMVGAHDRNVDVAETERIYAETFGSHLTVSHLDGAHSLARTVMEDNELIGLTTGIIWPRALLASGTIDDYRSFLVSFGD
ncbi:alpha/beta hydrolase family protein [Microbacterium sp. PMB16]|uniref:alpha/beta hydrolase family protein n=1 Tax=Microbacterium sp. PMB16 TaxID=3120157 RepID=UPI003F4C332B